MGEISCRVYYVRVRDGLCFVFAFLFFVLKLLFRCLHWFFVFVLGLCVFLRFILLFHVGWWFAVSQFPLFCFWSFLFLSNTTHPVSSQHIEGGFFCIYIYTHTHTHTQIQYFSHHKFQTKDQTKYFPPSSRSSPPPPPTRFLWTTHHIPPFKNK